MKKSNGTFKLIGKYLIGIIVFIGIITFISRVGKREGFESGQGQGIPKIIIQTSKNKPPQKVINNFKKVLSPGWIYKHFDDNEIIDFFKNNPIDEFPDVIEKFNSFKSGAHKADLFRYYYIYKNGGVFVDSDAVLEKMTDDVVGNYDFFSVNSLVTPNSIFQGFIGAVPRNEIIYKALKDIYEIDPKILEKRYFTIVENLYKIVNENKYNFKIKLFEEKRPNKDPVAITYDPDTGDVVLKHYFSSKDVPSL